MLSLTSIKVTLNMIDVVLRKISLFLEQRELLMWSTLRCTQVLDRGFVVRIALILLLGVGRFSMGDGSLF